MGKFIISLDFEMFWGVRDKQTISSYGENVRNEHVIVPRLLKLFNQYNISATWAIVGLLFCKNKEDILKYLPTEKPSYTNTELSPYNDIGGIGYDYFDDPYHFGRHLVDNIIEDGNQEIATHTFGHYYCLESGQNVNQFRADLQSAILIAKDSGLELNSIIFPRNQYSNEYIDVCKSLSVCFYRGNESHWAYQSYNDLGNQQSKRLFRFLDSYLNLSGHHTYKTPKIINGVVNFPASRFLRPYSQRLKIFENIKLKRIKNSMLYAAKSNQIYHLWWHPHNFGADMNESFYQLEQILIYYTFLKHEYGMKNLCMRDAYYGESGDE